MRREFLLIYLHGFASGPSSSKATRFRNHFETRGVPLLVPDLEGGDFRNLTLSSQMNVIRDVFYKNPAERYGVIGSSMGGYLALLTAQLQPLVRGLYLMCPGINFVSRWKERVNSEIHYKHNIPCLIQVFNYRYNKIMEVNSSLFQDGINWDLEKLDRRLPTRLVHGVHDEVVPVESSRAFHRDHPWVELIEPDSDHGLLSCVDWIVEDAFRFFQRTVLINKKYG